MVVKYYTKQVKQILKIDLSISPSIVHLITNQVMVKKKEFTIAGNVFTLYFIKNNYKFSLKCSDGFNP
jgi:hypothetical protein